VVNVVISDATFFYVAHEFNDLASTATNHQPRERQNTSPIRRTLRAKTLGAKRSNEIGLSLPRRAPPGSVKAGLEKGAATTVESTFST
jgi:hypothetical protein